MLTICTIELLRFSNIEDNASSESLERVIPELMEAKLEISCE
jgi:hypothetical protein